MRCLSAPYTFSPYVRGLLEELSIDIDGFVKPILNRRTYVRINTLKVSLGRFFEESGLALRQTALPYAFEYLGSNKVADEEASMEKTSVKKIGKTMEYFMGWIHPQAFSSMLPPAAFNLRLPCCGSAEEMRILDIAAAPGSKTSQLAQLTFNRVPIVAVDKRIDRLSLLVSNLDRLGVTSVAVYRGDARVFSSSQLFTHVLADVPCSSLGSSVYAWKKTNRHRIRDMARVQRRIILSAFDALKPGGELIYSTCTITPEENEAVVDHLLQNRPEAKLLKVELPMPFERGLSEYESSAHVARIYPWHVNSEAFFIAKITKES